MTVHLDALRDLGDATFGFGTVEAMELYLRRSPIVAELREQLEDGVLLEDDLLRFGCFLVDSIKSAEHFADETALAAVLFLANFHPGRSAQSFVADIASTNPIEIPLASRFAKRLLSSRMLLSAHSDASSASTSERFSGPQRDQHLALHSSAQNVGPLDARLRQDSDHREEILRIASTVRGRT